MKKILFLFCSIICLLQIYSQGLDYTHNLVTWGNVGYSRISVNTPETTALGGVGANIGFGYEYHCKRFILQTGVDVQRFSSAMTYDDFRHIVQMRDTDGRDFTGVFDFAGNKECQFLYNVTIPLLAGLSFYDVYFLAGGKIQFNFNNKIKTSSNVTSMAIYDMIIGSDGQGLLYDMPNHGLTSVKRTTQGNLDFSPVYIASFEIGKMFKPAVKRNPRNARVEYFKQLKDNENWLKHRVFSRHYYRFAFFCDYGFTSLKGNRPDMIINTATQPQAYAPALNQMLYGGKNIQTLYAGLKFTLIFEFTGKYPCQCDF